MATAEPAVLRLLQGMDPERAHDVSMWALRHGLVGPRELPPYPSLTMQLWGLQFENPLGIAAGFDKNAAAIAGLVNLGFGFVEVGSITPRPQGGHPRPRLFRLPEERGVINRMGFNNEGLDVAEANIRAWRESAGEARRPPLGINLGKNKDSTDALGDYAEGLRRLGPLADYITVNVSSPNTPGLRDLQAAKALDELITGLQSVRNELPETSRPPLLLKIAPDLNDADLADIAGIALARKLDGLIVSNTTVARPPILNPRWQEEAGGLSGAPLFELSTSVLRQVYAFR
jgi:dihydroorotate dehydrogenase